MPIRVAFDLDGTVADMLSVLQHEAEKLFGKLPARPITVEVSPGGSDTPMVIPEAELPATHLTLDSHQRTRLWRHVQTIPNFWINLPETEAGIVQRIASLTEERRWEVIFLTTRPAVRGLTTQVQSQQWLEAHGFRWPSVYVVERSRGRIADALQLDAVVDDRSENCLDVALESKAAAIWVERSGAKNPLPAAKRLGIRVVPTTTAAVAMLQKIDDATQGSGVMRSIKRLFGDGE